MFNAVQRNNLSQYHQALINESGVTLVELMISMALGLFILAGVLQMYATSSQNARANDGVLRIQENIRYAMSRLEEDISQAGNLGCLSFIYDQHESETSLAGASETSKENFILNILSNRTGENDWNRAISATNGATDMPDSLTLRYLSPLGRIPIAGVDRQKQHFMVDINNSANANAFNQLQQFDIAVAASCSNAMVFMIANDPVEYGYIAFGHTSDSKNGQKNQEVTVDDSFFEKIVGREGEPPGAIYAYPSGVYTYSIGKAARATDNCSNDNPENCALMLNDRELIEGVQDFQVEFGHQFGGGVHPNLQFVPADADSLTDDRPGWGSVDRIRITMTFNSIDRIPTNQGSQLITKTVTKVFALPNQLLGTE